MPTDMTRALEPVLKSLDHAISLADDPKASATGAPDISGWTVLQHLEHLLIADTGIIGWLVGASEGKAEQGVTGGVTILGRIVLLFGRIPRGKGKAPARTVPTGTDRADIARGYREQRALVERLGGTPELISDRSSKLKHPVFGALSPRQWLRFIVVHHNHHGRIMADVLKHGTAP